MIANNETIAYIVHATEDAMRSLSDFDFTFTPKDTFRNAETLDLDALRLVLRAAEYGQESRQDFGIEDEYLDEWNATESAIAKIEAILK